MAACSIDAASVAGERALPMRAWNGRPTPSQARLFDCVLQALHYEKGCTSLISNWLLLCPQVLQLRCAGCCRQHVAVAVLLLRQLLYTRACTLEAAVVLSVVVCSTYTCFCITHPHTGIDACGIACSVWAWKMCHLAQLGGMNLLCAGTAANLAGWQDNWWLCVVALCRCCTLYCNKCVQVPTGSVSVVKW